MKFLLASLIAFQSFPALADISCSYQIVSPDGSRSREYVSHTEVNIDAGLPAVEINSDDSTVRLTVRNLVVDSNPAGIEYSVKLERNGRTLAISDGLAWGRYSFARNIAYDTDGTAIEYICWGSVD